MVGKEDELERGPQNPAAVAEEFVTLQDVAMDFTMQDWEQLGLHQEDLFWDGALNSYQDPSVSALPDVTETKHCLLQQGFLEERLSQELMEVFSKEGLNFETYLDESWLDSLLGDPENLPRCTVSNKERPTKCQSLESKSSLSPGPLLSTAAHAGLSGTPEKNLTPVTLMDCTGDIEQSQQNSTSREKLYKCKECGQSFSCSYHLIRHQVIHTREKTPAQQEKERGLSKGVFLLVYPKTHTGQKPYRCKECGKMFSQNTYLQWHQKIHTEENLCKNQEKLCSKTQDSHQEKSPTSQTDDVENMSKGQGDDHTFILQPWPMTQNTPVGTKSYICKKCRKTFNQAFHLAAHQQVHTQRLYKCATCPAVFNLRKQFLQHRKTHLAKTLCECEECGKTFRQRSSLIEHQTVHTGKKPYECNECGKTFSHSSTLKIHQRVHSGEKPYKCDECGKAFGRSAHLHEHQRIHTGYRPHQCPECAKSFSRPSHLTRHQLSHATGKLLSCAKCKKTFSCEELLVQHQKIHTVSAPYECQECGEHFICSSTLNCHLSSHTRERQGFHANEKVLSQNVKFNEKHFKCDKHGETFGPSTDLVQHKETHTNMAPIECSQSGKSFGRIM